MANGNNSEGVAPGFARRAGTPSGFGDFPAYDPR
jgi:hypothetical protein